MWLIVELVFEGFRVIDRLVVENFWLSTLSNVLSLNTLNTH